MVREKVKRNAAFVGSDAVVADALKPLTQVRALLHVADDAYNNVGDDDDVSVWPGAVIRLDGEPVGYLVSGTPFVSRGGAGGQGYVTLPSGVKTRKQLAAAGAFSLDLGACTVSASISFAPLLP
jgi:hypothetical protein